MPGQRRLTWLPDAVRDLRRLDEYIRPHNPTAANRLTERIREATRSLLEHPEIGKPYAPAAAFRELFFTFGSRGFVLRYRIEGKAIIVVRIWHALENR